MAEDNRPRLGRGLAALLGDAGPESAVMDRAPRRVPIEFIRPNPRNPRRTFTDDGLEELSASIREKGLIQPIVIRALDGAPRQYEIIAGERRWRASQRAGLHDVPVVIVEATEKESLEIAIIENVQRSDLNPIEEARGYGQLMKEFEYTQSDLSKIISKSRSHVANMLRLLNLPDSILSQVENGLLTAGHARALLAFDEPEPIAARILSENLNVREVEELGRLQENPAQVPTAAAAPTANQAKDPNITDLERTLSNALGLKVEIRHKRDGGELRIRYASIDQLDGVCERLK